MKVYGYIRTSSVNQRIDRQMIDLQAHNVPKESIFVDKKSGKNFDRPNYRALVKKLRRGDLLYIQSINQLGHSTDEMQKQWEFLTQEKNIDIFVIDTPCLDTRVKAEFLREFINNLFLYVLSFLAENERVTSRKRQAEGIRAAKKRGVRFGRTRTPLPENFMECCELYLAHALTVREAAEECGMAKSTFSDAVKRVLEEREEKEEQSTEKTTPKSTERKTKPSEQSAQTFTKEDDPSILEMSQNPQQSTEWENNWTEILTFTRKIPELPFSEAEDENKSVAKSRKSTGKHKESGRK